MNKKEEIIQVTAELLQIQGYFATGINEIVEKSKAPKGSVYHYFKNGKDEIVNEALQYSGNQIKLLLESISLNATNLPEFVNNAFDFFITNLTESSYTKGCPIATTAMEICGKTANLDGTIREIYRGWHTVISDTLSRHNVKADADIFISLIEGALVNAKMQRSIAPLESAKKLAIQLVTGPG